MSSTRLTRAEISELLSAAGNWLIGLTDELETTARHIELHEDPEWEYRSDTELQDLRKEEAEIAKRYDALASGIEKLQRRRR